MMVGRRLRRGGVCEIRALASSPQDMLDMERAWADMERAWREQGMETVGAGSARNVRKGCGAGMARAGTNGRTGTSGHERARTGAAPLSLPLQGVI